MKLLIAIWIAVVVSALGAIVYSNQVINERVEANKKAHSVYAPGVQSITGELHDTVTVQHYQYTVDGQQLQGSQDF